MYSHLPELAGRASKEPSQITNRIAWQGKIKGNIQSGYFAICKLWMEVPSELAEADCRSLVTFKDGLTGISLMTYQASLVEAKYPGDYKPI